MKTKIFFIATIISLFTSVTYGLTISNTYTAGDIPTGDGAYDMTCNGPVTLLTVTLPAGGPWIVTSIDVEYDMTSLGGAWMEEQWSQVFCQNTGIDEGGYINGSGGNAGTFNYNRPSVNIANGQYPGGTGLIFEMRAFRDWTNSAGCNTDNAKIDDGTWIVTVNYELAAPMVYVDANTFHASIANVQNCVSTANILRLEVETSGTLTPFDLTSIDLTTNGSTDLSEISDINVYYTGTVNSFSNVNIFGTITSGGSVTVNGTQTLEAGMNYFWVEYVLNSPTTIGNILDGTCASITVDGSAQVPSSTNPAGSRSIGICNPSPGGIDNDLTLWLDAKNGAESGGSPATTASQVDSWVNRITNPGVPDVNQTTGNRQPIFNENELNYNPVVSFDGDNDRLKNNVLGGDLFDSQDNTIVLVHKFNTGLVYFKWESTVSNRIGIENEVGTNFTRFDFANDDPANQTIGSFNYLPNGQLVTAVSNNNTSLLRNMGEQNVLNTSINQSLNVSETNDLAIGNNVPDFGATDIDFAEIIVYKRALNEIELNKVESYLAIKYGMTLGVNGVSLNYNSAGGNVVWDIVANTGYNFDIAGVSRDDNSGQDQRKSKSINMDGANERDILTLSNGVDFDNPSQFTDDVSFLIWGNNDGTLTNTGSQVDFLTDNGQTMVTIFDKQWKSQETGVVDDVVLRFDMTNSSIELGSGPTNYNNVRLLVDEDGDFSTGATAYLPTSFDVATNLIYFSHDFMPSDGNDLSQNNGFFFTLASVSSGASEGPITANFQMSDSTICVGEEVSFVDLSNNNPINWNWTVTSENGNVVNTQVVQGPVSFTFNEPGVYEVNLAVGNTISNDDSTLTIEVYALPNSSFDILSDDFIAPYEGLAVLNLSLINESTNYVMSPNISADTTFIWSFGKFDDSTYITSDVSEIITQSYDTEGEYEICLVVVGNVNGCKDTSCQSIIVYDQPSLELPNVFTPDGDGINDIFFFPNNAIIDFNCKVFDRWGKQVYEFESIEDGWDGINMNNNIACSDGVYFYIYEGRSSSGISYKGQGNINLIRKI